jgi:hypothetical protein
VPAAVPLRRAGSVVASRSRSLPGCRAGRDSNTAHERALLTHTGALKPQAPPQPLCRRQGGRAAAGHGACRASLGRLRRDGPVRLRWLAACSRRPRSSSRRRAAAAAGGGRRRRRREGEPAAAPGVGAWGGREEMHPSANRRTIESDPGIELGTGSDCADE